MPHFSSRPPRDHLSRCPRCRTASSDVEDHGSELELNSAENACSSCGFVFDGGIDVEQFRSGKGLPSCSYSYGAGFSQFDSLGRIAGGVNDHEAPRNWVSEEGAVAARPTPSRYRGNATRFALPRPRHSQAFAKLAALCGQVRAPRGVAESAKAMLRAALASSSSSSSSSSKPKTSSPSPSSSSSPPSAPSLPHALLGGACLLLAARRERAALFPADVAAALSVDSLRLARAAAAVAEASRAGEEGSAAPVGAGAFLRRELPGLVRGRLLLLASGNGAAAVAAATTAATIAKTTAQTLEDALTLVRWVESGACASKTSAHGPTLAAAATLLAAAGRGVVLGGAGSVAASFRVASAPEVARCEAGIRKGLCQLAAARLPWLRRLRVGDVERHARALVAAARVAAAEAEEEEEEERKRRRKRKEVEAEVEEERAEAAASEEGGDNDDDASAAAAAVADLEEEDEEELIREEDWALYLRRPEEVEMAAVALAAREKAEEQERGEGGREESSGVATPVQRPRKRACFVK